MYSICAFSCNKNLLKGIHSQYVSHKRWYCRTQCCRPIPTRANRAKFRQHLSGGLEIIIELVGREWPFPLVAPRSHFLKSPSRSSSINQIKQKKNKGNYDKSNRVLLEYILVKRCALLGPLLGRSILINSWKKSLIRRNCWQTNLSNSRVAG
jgi:hypothetical protein